MPETHWINLSIERLEKLLYDNVARKYLLPEIQASLFRERSRLIRAYTAAYVAECAAEDAALAEKA